MARSAVFADAAGAIDFARSLEAEDRGIVVKADGLAAGKGVTVAHDLADAISAIRSTISGGPVVIEERLSGREASSIALADGHDALALPLARDHKRLSDGDVGPNTGGMGAYSPLPDLPDDAADDLLERFHRPILRELARRGTPFRGALYAGLILTATGPVLLECNARFGDPETQALMPRLASPLGPLLLAAARGRLADATLPLGLAGPRIPALPSSTAAVVLAAAGYPGTPRTSDRISGLGEPDGDPDTLVFHSGTVRDATDGYQTAGGRILSVVGRGVDLEAARTAAARRIRTISFHGAHHRTDIGLDAPVPEAVR
jgi:phosphoribosylamine--glycine ligase